MTSYITSLLHELSLIFSSTPIPQPPPSSSSSSSSSIPTPPTQTTLLPSGRTLAYTTFGTPAGKPIFFMHGMPGSRLDAMHFHSLGIELNARIIGIDRPGMGSSTRQKDRTLRDFAGDVEFLAKSLGLQKYSVMGASGGGPSVLACARYLPASQLACAAIICGLGPPHISMWGADIKHFVGFPYGVRWAPYWMGRVLWRLDALGRVELPDEERLEMCLEAAAGVKGSEKSVVGDVEFLRKGLMSSREAFWQGYDGVWDDAKVCTREFGFGLGEIRGDLPVKMWYGRGDVFVPLGHGEGIYRELRERAGGKGKVELRVEEEGHAGIFYNWRREILEGVLKEMRD